MENIILTGASGVGKTLIAQKLSEKTGMPFVSIDELDAFVNNEIDGIVTGCSDAEIEKLKHDCMASILEDKSVNKQSQNPALLAKQKELVDVFVEEYAKYAKMFGGNLSIFHETIKQYNSVMDSMYIADCSDIMRLAFQQYFSLQLMLTVFENVNEPIIMDTSALQGWNFSTITPTRQDLAFFKKHNLNFRYNQLNSVSKQIFKERGTTVLLIPGIDYFERTSKINSPQNQLLLDNYDAFYNMADICIPTNGIFNKTTSSAFHNRHWFDAKATTERERLMNNGEVANICDSIISQIEELSISKQYSK